MTRLKHSKKRNLGLVYEFLAREVSSAIVSGDRGRASKAIRIIEKYLSPNKELYEEMSMHRQVVESRGVSERLARRIVDELKAAGVRFSARGQLREKSKTAMIHEINRTIGQEVFDRYRIPDYSAHASIAIIMGRGAGQQLDEAVDGARVEDHLIEFLTSPPVEPVRFDRDASLYAYKTAVGLFEQQYGAELSAAQSSLLKEYVRVSLGGNPAPFQRTFEKQRKDLREVLRSKRTDEVFSSDAEMASQLDEAIAGLESLDASQEESVERLMLYHNLSKELKS